ncbi:MAG: 23S rRNA (guanosine(2251)-2'-O)-methyltransferase RlmB [Chlamydiae bacterium CG10_big_fil_rev_8_21_14_0_10_35_9]|nr:MAG: 23S rRNA (guanosine(2251)-2'-O)-methyltransferase RlmB [Chlamydiae bacterium CG10_big_fil_rev_8_21_14_0_10_35_9]
MTKKTSSRFIMGVHCLEEVISHSPERIVAIYAIESALKRNFLTSVKHLVKLVRKDELTKMVQSDSHQGLVAKVKEKKAIFLKEFIESIQDRPTSCLLLLDNINDPQNLGTILRSADCFKVDAVIWSKNRGADITPIVTKTSSGASELVNTIKVSNLAETVVYLKKQGYETIAAHADKEADSLFRYQFGPKVAFIMGSEGKGIQPLVLKRTDQSLYIPMYGQVDSLNVSQATAVFLSHFAKAIY